MSTTELWQTIVTVALTVVGSVGGAGVIILGLSAWIGRVWADRIQNRTTAKYERELEEIRNRYNVELEKLRSVTLEQQNFRDSALDLLSGGYSRSHERILTAVESFWKKHLDVRSFAQKYIFVYSVLLSEEIEAIDMNKLTEIVPDTSSTGYTQQVAQILSGLEDVRPFLGEKLWALFVVYRTFVLRMGFKLVEGRASGKLFSWDKDLSGKKDKALLDILRSAIGSSEFEEMCRQPFPIQIIQETLERKILMELNELIFGKQFVDRSIEEYSRINSLLSASMKVENISSFN